MEDGRWKMEDGFKFIFCLYSILPDSGSNERLKKLLNESLELKKIFSAIKLNTGKK